MNAFIFSMGLYIGLIFSLLLRRYLGNRSKFTTGDGIYIAPKGTHRICVEMVGGGGGGSATINGVTVPGEPGRLNGEGGHGGMAITDDKGRITKIYYNQKGERVVEEQS